MHDVMMMEVLLSHVEPVLQLAVPVETVSPHLSTVLYPIHEITLKASTIIVTTKVQQL